ncbi:PREDICTED: uncharacterized protein LOC105619067 isoform X2 [Atta cephalotes]|uniref:Uncharacterized protein n=1 Tax=Atta cephalotes TaxID=12957 RepID=A0A158NEM9_ATTCE|nr:PREDICTED: uncharacterized protein LOC105619067 isoform X2 [Atta cephalotes]XP_018052208.1 PREDICTED: uncharacterized protein LOC108689780 [Atta colombica]
MYRTFLGATAILMMIELNVYTATDWWWGAKDPFGPYPRIPNKDLVKKEITFAEECRKFITAPKDEWY